MIEIRCLCIVTIHWCIMITEEQLKKFTEQIKTSGYPLEHWASSLLRKEGWFVTTNCYYIDSDDKKPREMDIIAFKLARLDRFKVKTVLMISCKKSQNSVWGFLRRSFPEYGNQINLFPVMISSKFSPVNFSLQNLKWWPREFCEFMDKRGLSNWFGVPQYDVFAYQQIPLLEKGKLHDSDMHSSTMQLIKAQAYEMPDRHHGHEREIVQFNLISLTEGDFVAFNFNDDGAIDAVNISEQVSLSSYKIDNRDHESRIIYLTKKKFEDEVSTFTKLHELNKEFFALRENEFRDGAIFDDSKINVHYEEFISRIESYILQCSTSFNTPPYTIPKLKIHLSSAKGSEKPIVSISSQNCEILQVACYPAVKERINRELEYFWGYCGDVDIRISSSL